MSGTQREHTAQKMKFSIMDFFYKCDQIFRWKEILDGKLYFLCSDINNKQLAYPI